MALGRAFALATLRPLLLTVLVVGTVGALVVTGRAIGAAAVAPPLGLGVVMLVGLVPMAVGVALPVGVLVGTVTAAQSWRTGGELMGLQSLGLTVRRLGVAAALVGGLAGIVEGALTHVLEPAGRRQVKHALETAALELALQPQEPVRVGSMLLRAERVGESGYEDVFLASDDLVATAAAAHPGTGGTLVLDDGEAVRLERGEPAYRIQFGRAVVPLATGELRLDAADMAGPQLRDRVDKMRAEGRSASFEAMTLYKRTALPLNLPLLGLFGVALGARGVRPAWAALGTTLGWWAILRVCDQAVDTLGPLVAAVAPGSVLALVTLVAWGTWREAR